MRWHSASEDTWLNPGLWGMATSCCFDSSHWFKGMPRIKKRFNLVQNYPNPFNPTTEIRYTIHTPAEVNLTVYNVLGKKVVTLVNEFQNPNIYNYQFNGAELSSGVYIYKLTVGSNVETKKMILMK